jgi:hypothetical protein
MRYSPYISKKIRAGGYCRKKYPPHVVTNMSPTSDKQKGEEVSYTAVFSGASVGPEVVASGGQMSLNVDQLVTNKGVRKKNSLTRGSNRR